MEKLEESQKAAAELRAKKAEEEQQKKMRNPLHIRCTRAASQHQPLCQTCTTALPVSVLLLSVESLVRKRGFEPLRSCDRQPLKLVRLPVPPLPQLRGTRVGELVIW